MRSTLEGVLALCIVIAAGLVACQSEEVPRPGSEAYETAVTAFYTGVSALQVGENCRAERALGELFV